MSTFSFIDLPLYGRVSRDKPPNLCPHCQHKVNSEELNWGITSSLHGKVPQLECVFRCANEDCNHLFVAVYTLTKHEPTSDVEKLAKTLGCLGSIFQLTSAYPLQIPKSEFSQEIVNVSSSFVDIYHQAEEAEARGLAQICGMGYRKAVECLVKDYCIRSSPHDEAAIKVLPVAQCIAKYIHETRIESVAKRAIWLGNDEAHYVRKWVDKDVADLKILIRLATNWIENSMLTSQYQEDMK